MKNIKRFLATIAATLCMGVILSWASVANAVPTTLIEQGAAWDYSVLGTNLWPSWGTVGYSTVNWGSLSWSTGNAAFGNPYSLPYNTYWAANTDLALQTDYNLNGTINGNLLLQVASDNGFAVFVNGNQVAKYNAEGYTTYWEYNLSIPNTSFNQGLNTISVLAEDHGGATFFDLRLTADILPNQVPEPSSILLLGSGLAGLGLFARRRKK